MEFGEIRDRERLEASLRLDTGSHLYALADLDEPFWNDTRWFAAQSGGEIRAVALLLSTLEVPILYAVCPPDDPPTRALLDFVRPRLPRRVFVNLGLGLATLFCADDLASEGEFAKYRLADSSAIDGIDTSQVAPLGAEDLADVQAFLRDQAYGGDESESRFFEPYMIERWPFAAVRERGRLIGVGGVHALSDRYRVAVLGNIATRPDRRGRGVARAVTAHLCRALSGRVDHLGLNVHVSNAAAIRCYERLGFRSVRRYLEGMLTLRPS